MLKSEIKRIEKEGRQVALSVCWRYYLLNDCIYAVSDDGKRCSVWCGLDRLGQHLHRLYQITGRAFFTDGCMWYDPEFVRDYTFA